MVPGAGAVACSHAASTALLLPSHLQATPPPARHLTTRQQSAEDDGKLRCVFDSFATWGKSAAQAAAGAAARAVATLNGGGVGGICCKRLCSSCLPAPLQPAPPSPCAGGEPSLDGAQLQKLCRDAELLNRQLTSTRLDLLFSAAVGKVRGAEAAVQPAALRLQVGWRCAIPCFHDFLPRRGPAAWATPPSSPCCRAWPRRAAARRPKSCGAWLPATAPRAPPPPRRRRSAWPRRRPSQVPAVASSRPSP